LATLENTGIRGLLLRKDVEAKRRLKVLWCTKNAVQERRKKENETLAACEEQLDTPRVSSYRHCVWRKVDIHYELET